MGATPAPPGLARRRRRALVALVPLVALALMATAMLTGVEPLLAAQLLMERSGGASAAAAAAAAAASSEQPTVRPDERVPKVALMFLTRGPLPLARVWEAWLAGADGVLPVPTLARLGCSRQQVELIQSLVPGLGTNATLPLYQRQQLFSIYVHAPPSYMTPYDPNSIFAGRKLEQWKRVNTTWGTHSLVAAARALLREALADPLNQRFMLLSESDMPLWPAGLTYLQVMAEPWSRAMICHPSDDELDFRQSDLLKFPRDQWRKNSQWFIINRHHAQLYVDDHDIDPRFSKDCFVRWDLNTWKPRPGDQWCVSDEHYLSVLLAARKQEHALSCAAPGGLSYPVWTIFGAQYGPHPRTYTAVELNLAMIQHTRKCPVERADQALRDYSSLLVRPERWTQEACEAAADAAAAAAEGEGDDRGDAAGSGGGRRLMRRLRAAAAAAAAAAGEAAGAEGEQPGGSSSSSGSAAAAIERAAAAEAAQARPLLPPYQCFITLRKVAVSAAASVAQSVEQGMLDKHS